MADPTPSTEPKVPEVPKGASYLHVSDFYREWNNVFDQSRDDSGAFRRPTLRVYGKQLVEKPSITRPGTTYHELVDSSPGDINAYVDCSIHSINPQRVNVNINRDGKMLAGIHIDDSSIASFRLKAIPFDPSTTEV